jgi:hypothetical protein
MKTIDRIIGEVFVGLNVVDIGLTLCIVGAGIGTEINPVMAKILALPVLLIIAYKFLLPVTLVVCVLLIGKWLNLHKINVRRVLITLVALEAGVCLFNLAGLVL